ncbi:hypothetical protein BH24ACT15_BH24ACT15_08320 [soil metagenome]
MDAVTAASRRRKSIREFGLAIAYGVSVVLVAAELFFTSALVQSFGAYALTRTLLVSSVLLMAAVGTRSIFLRCRSQPHTWFLVYVIAEFVLVVAVSIGVLVYRQPDLDVLMFAVVATLSLLSLAQTWVEVRGRLNRRSPEAVRAAA